MDMCLSFRVLFYFVFFKALTSTALPLAVWISAVFVVEPLGPPIAVFVQKDLRIRIEAKIPSHQPEIFAGTFKAKTFRSFGLKTFPKTDS